MSKRTSRVALALAVVCAGVSLAYAANPTFWQVSNEAEFSKGDVENLSILGLPDGFYSFQVVEGKSIQPL